MPNVGEAWYELNARDAKLLAALRASEAAAGRAGHEIESEISDGFERAGDGATDEIEDALKKTGVQAGIAGEKIEDELVEGFDDAGRRATGEAAGITGALNKLEREADKTGDDIGDELGDGFDKGEKRAKDALGDIETAGDKLKRQMGNVGMGIMQGFGQAIWGQVSSAAAGAFDAMIGGASDWQENISKSQAVFGGLASDIETWAADAPERLALTQSAALGAASSFGNLFVAMKMPQEAAGEMSKSLVDLATDLASFNNVTVDDALEALRSGMVGETEPMRKFGVMLDESTIKLKAVELGLISSVKQGLTPAQKAQASYAAIMEQTSVAQGDFARTSEGFANQQRILSATMADGMAKLGTKILPLVNQILPKLVDVAILVFDNLFKVADLVGEVLSVAFGDFLPITIGLAGGIAVALIPALVGLAASAGTAALAMLALAAPMIVAAAPFVALGLAVGALFIAFQNNFFGIRDIVRDVAGGLLTIMRGLVTTLLESVRAIVDVASKIPGPWQEALEDVRGTLDEITDSVEGWDIDATLDKAFVQPIDAATADAMIAFGGYGDQVSVEALAAGEKTAEAVGEGFKPKMEAVSEEMKQKARDLPQKIADGIADARQRPLDAFQSMLDGLKKPMSVTAETSRLIGQLTGKQLAAGLASADPQVRAQARAAREAILDRLNELKPRAGTVGTEAMTKLSLGIRSKDTTIANASKAITGVVKNNLPSWDQGRQWGANAGSAYANGILSARHQAANAAIAVSRAVAGGWRKESPMDPSSPLYRHEAWAKNLVHAYADAIRSQAFDARAAAATVAGAVAGGMAGGPLTPAFAMPGVNAGVIAGAGGVSGGITVNVDIGEFVGNRENIEMLVRRLGEHLRLTVPR